MQNLPQNVQQFYPDRASSHAGKQLECVIIIACLHQADLILSLQMMTVPAALPQVIGRMYGEES